MRQKYRKPCPLFLIVVEWNAIAENFIVADAPSVLDDSVARITFNRVDIAILDLFNNAYMIRLPVQSVLVIPVKEDDVAGVWNI